MKILKFMIMVLFFVLCINYVSADTFVKGEFIAGEYISKVKDNKTYYLTIQYIKDSDGRAVFCLEPFVDFKSGKDYQEYLWDDEDYYDLSDDVKRKIELITYYGYGYKNRTSHKWYAITQYLLWVNIDKDADIYFTDILNGKKIIKYEDEINQIMNDVNNHDIAPSFSTGIEINLGDEVRIDNFFEEFNIYENDFLWENSNNTLVIRDLKDDIVLEFYRISNYHDKDVVLFVSDEYQDLIRPGNVNEPNFEVPIKIKKGKIGLDIINDGDVYTIEASFDNTCYEIVGVIDKICTNEGMKYDTGDLKYGEYIIRQVSNGIGYRKDSKEYKVTIGDTNLHPVITLHNYLIRNDINLIKYACKDEICLLEEGAVFEIYDKDNNLVNSLKTDINGSANVTLGYGEYYISQVKGMENYSVVADFSEKIVDEVSNHSKELFNYYIKTDLVNNEIVPEEEPPNTRSDINKTIFITKNIFVIFFIPVCIFLKRCFK